MVDPQERSRKQSSGNSGPRSRKRPKRYTFYLDEDSDCSEIKEALDRHGARYRSYSQDVPPHSGTFDEKLYPQIAKRTCVFITKDYHQRYRERERIDMLRYGIRHFALPGNLGGKAMADLLIKAKNAIFEFSREHDAPFSVDISKDGTLNPRLDKNGIISESKKKK